MLPRTTAVSCWSRRRSADQEPIVKIAALERVSATVTVARLHNCADNSLDVVYHVFTTNVGFYRSNTFEHPGSELNRAVPRSRLADIDRSAAPRTRSRIQRFPRALRRQPVLHRKADAAGGSAGRPSRRFPFQPGTGRGAGRVPRFKDGDHPPCRLAPGVPLLGSPRGG